jgi:hypothetical protein
MILRPIALILLVLACSRNDVSDFWRAGGTYQLVLVLGARPSLIPEQDRHFSPAVDTATLLLTVDSILAAKAYGKIAGEWKISSRTDYRRSGAADNKHLSESGIAATVIVCLRVN